MKTSKPLPMTVFWLYIRIAIMLISLSSILAAVLLSVDLSGLAAFKDLFQILP